MNEELEVIRAVLEHSDEIVMMCRKGGINLSFSEAAVKVFGPPRFIGLQEDDAERYGLFYPGTEDLIPTPDLPMARALKGQTVRDVLISVRRPDQPEYLVSLNAGPLRDTHGNAYGGVLVGVILDVRPEPVDGGHARQGRNQAHPTRNRNNTPDLLEKAAFMTMKRENQQEQAE